VPNPTRDTTRPVASRAHRDASQRGVTARAFARRALSARRIARVAMRRDARV
jgi:hypothetical protein